LYVEVDKEATNVLREEWMKWDIGVPLVVIRSPFRSVLRPLVRYVERLERNTPGELVTVVVPEIVPQRWWEHLLHNKTALYIRSTFMFRPNVVVTAVPYHVGSTARLRDLLKRSTVPVTAVAPAPVAAPPIAAPATLKTAEPKPKAS
ncbi:MAG TPA: hypothetical protein VL980_05790, partial [Gemmatimonadaceae bacterium]|nr:hypothetical protein [Gemmatimonadaceae bacterium]